MTLLVRLSILLVTACSVALAQQSATVEAPEVVQAGEIVDLGFSLDPAPNFEGSQITFFIKGPGSFDMSTGCPVPRGERGCHVTFRMPEDVPSGTAIVTRVALFTGSRQIDLSFRPVSFKVIARTEPLVFPTSAEVTIRPSQVQLLRGEAMRLKEQVRFLKADASGVQEPLRSATIAIFRDKVETELRSLSSTESKFRELGDKSQGETVHVFFDDIRAGYSEVLSALPERRKQARVSSRVVQAAWSFGPQGSSERQSAQYPLAAQAVFRAFEHNELAYNLVAEKGRLTFDLEADSSPEGAAISYGRRGDVSYKRHPNPTNSTIKALPYAVWTIRFQKPGFKDKDIEFNPFVEPNRVVTAVLDK